MAAVERVEYMDSQKSAMMEEAIRREQRVQREYFRREAEAGRLKAPPPHEETPAEALKTLACMPDFYQTIKDDPELMMGIRISKNTWMSNPGYILRDGPKTVSTFKEQYIWDSAELEFMESLGMRGKSHNRRRDDFTNYVEAKAKYSMLTKSNASG